MKLILVRHGETEWSKENRYTGTADISLIERGIEQAKLIAQILKKENISLIYSSMLRRAEDTASIIAQECGVGVLKDARLNELSFGDWEGLTFTEITKKTPDAWEKWQKEFKTFSPPGGESIMELRDRVLSFLDSLIDVQKDKTVIIVSHAGPIKIILLHALGALLESFWRLKQDLGGVSVVEYYKDGPLIISVNDTSHFRLMGGFYG